MNIAAPDRIVNIIIGNGIPNSAIIGAPA